MILFYFRNLRQKFNWFFKPTIVSLNFPQPYLIMFYSDWCFSCSKAEPTWANLVEELEPVGFGLAAVHTEHEKELARKLGAKELPHMVMLLDGKLVPYKGR